LPQPLPPHPHLGSGNQACYILPREVPLESLQTIVLAPFSRIFDPVSQTFWVTYIATAAFAGLFYLVSRRSRRTSLRGLLHYITARRFWRHPSLHTDIRFYFFSSMFLVVQAMVFLSFLQTDSWVMSGLEYVLGPSQPSPPPLIAQLLAPLALFLALEFGYWLAHYLMHRIPVLWEFHKVHHSAEILTPLTEARQHPIEYIFFPLVYGPLVAFINALFLWAYGEQYQSIPFWNMSVILLVFYLTILHSRHSHIKWNGRGWVGRILQTPGHHHIHHSIDPRHFNKNLGYCLSVWDWAFGTLCMPEPKQRITMGLGGEAGFDTLRNNLLTPFRTCLPHLRRRKSSPPQTTNTS